MRLSFILLAMVWLAACLPTISKGKLEARSVDKEAPKTRRAELPRLIAHDLGAGRKPKVHANRLFFKLVFEQPVILQEGEHVEIVSKDARNPAIAAKFSDDKTRLDIELSRQGGDSLEVQKSYAVIIASDADPMELLNFITIEPAPALKENLPVQIFPTSHSVEIKWQLNNAHQAQMRFGTSRAQLDCQAGPCPKMVSRSKDKKQESHEALSFFNVGSLQSDTTYYFSLEAIDFQGQSLKAEGSFVTESASWLRFSQIMIKPKVAQDMPEHQGEFIEIINIGDDAVELNGLVLSLANVWEGQNKKCRLEFTNPGLNLASKAHAIIAGSEFDPSLYDLPSATAILRLKNKTICGGLANSYPQRLKLHGASGGILDGYGAHFWPVEEGVSVKRIDVAGLDVAENYCYLAEGSGPHSAADAPKWCAPQMN